MSKVHKIYHQFAQPFFDNEQVILQDSQFRRNFEKMCQNPKSQMCENLGYTNIHEGLGGLTDSDVILVPIQNSLASFIIHTNAANLSALGLNWMISYELSQTPNSSIASIELCESCLHETNISDIQASEKKLFHFVLDPRFVLKSQVERGQILMELLVQAILEFEYSFCKYSIELDAYVNRMKEKQVWQLLNSKFEKDDVGSRISRATFNQIEDAVLGASSKILGFMEDLQKASDENELFDIVEQVQAYVLKNKNLFLLLDFCAQDIRKDFAYHRIYMAGLCGVPNFVEAKATPKSQSKTMKSNVRNFQSTTRFGESNNGLENYAWYTQENPSQIRTKKFKKED